MGIGQIVMANIVIDYRQSAQRKAHIVMAHIVMAHIVMAHIVMAYRLPVSNNDDYYRTEK